MSASPSKNRTLSRQPSSPSLALGIPPPIPEGGVMRSSKSSSNLRSHHSQPRLYRGDVSSSAASSEDDGDQLGTPFKSAISPGADMTPKRKVVAMMEPLTAPRGGKKRDTLQARLEQAARMKKSKSTGDGLNGSASMTSFSTNLASPSVIPSFRETPPATGGGSDKVVVCVRIKPTTSTFASSAYDVTPTSLALSDSHPNVQKRGGKAGREDEYTYTFDKLLQYPSTTPELYRAKVAPLVNKAMNGFNSTIFAYGQTGSGKSFTMTGTATELGIIPCAVAGVFDAISAETDRAYLLRVSYIEIYNETLRDLLNFKKGPLKDDEKPAIHTSKGKVYVEPLVENIVSTPREIVELLEKGNASRRVGMTDWNERSSRSHVVFTIVVESRPREGSGDDDIRLSRLNLIDLAGSEKAVSDLERRGEGKHINQSLLALREVINKLTEKKRTHIPYRNSKLTHLLENALGGDSNICVICTMSGDEEHHAETLETLKFAGRCSQVETKATKNIIASSEKALIRAKDREIDELKRRLQGIANGSDIEASQDISELADSVASMEARKSKLAEQLAKLNAEILTSERPQVGSGLLPLSPPRHKRPRTSDFTGLARPGRIGLGSPRAIVPDRRAVSGLVRMTEEDMPGIVGTLQTVTEVDVKAFDHDRLVASLRRELTAREGELASANRELSDALSRLARLSQAETEVGILNARVAEQETSARDTLAQLEATRNDLVATIKEKTSKIDELETAVLDLRKSREELAIDDQNRYDEVNEKLSRAIEEAASFRDEATGLQDQVNASEERLRVLQADLEAARAKCSEADQSREAQESRCNELENIVASLRSQVTTLEASHAAQASDISRLTAEHEAANRERQTALDQVSQLTIENESANREKQAAIEDLARYQRDSMQHESEVVAELREELSKLRRVAEEQSEQGKREVDGFKARVALLEDECARVTAQVSAERARAEAAEGRISTAEMAVTTSALRVDALLTESQRKTEELAKQTDEQADMQRRLQAYEEEQAALLRKVEALSEEKQDVLRRSDADNQDLVRRLEVSETAKSEAERELQILQQGAADSKGQAKHLQDELDRLATTLDHVQGEKSTIEGQLREAEDRALAAEGKVRDLEQGAVALMTKIEQLEGHVKDRCAEVDELRFSLQAVNTEKKALEAQVDVSSAATGRLETLQQAHLAAQQELQETRERSERVNGVVATLEAELATCRASLGRLKPLEEALASAQRELQETRAREEKSNRLLGAETQKADQLVQQLAALQQETDRLSSVDAELIGLRSATEAQRQHLDKLGKELSDARASALMEKERADHLATELRDSKAPPGSASTSSISARQRHAPTSFAERNASVKDLRLQALTTAATGSESMERLRTMESEEIERLEKVVEAQEVIISEQRDKIKYWSDELERQREIVRALTSDPAAFFAAASNSPNPASRASPSLRVSHAKSKSLSTVDPGSPLPRTATTSRLPSTFTAHNLALPTSPTPLPMHPSQFDNRGARKTRRVTIDKDMDRLTDSSKVHKAKALFDIIDTSPQKTPTKTGTRPETVPYSAPRQRKP